MIIQNEMDVKFCAAAAACDLYALGFECMMGPGSANGSWTWHGGENTHESINQPYLTDDHVQESQQRL